MAWWFFQNAAVTAILACGVLVMCRCVRIGPVARHALWVLVLVKFVTPPIVAWPWPAPDPLGLAPVEIASPQESDAAPAPLTVSVESRIVSSPEIIARPACSCWRASAWRCSRGACAMDARPIRRS